MLHHCKGLALDFEAGDDFASVHPRLDELEGDFATYGRLLLGKVDDAKTAFADALDEFVGADDAAGGQQIQVGFPGPSAGRVEKVSGVEMSLEQGQDIGGQCLVAVACLNDKRSARFGGRDLDSIAEDGLNLWCGSAHGRRALLPLPIQCGIGA